MTKSVFVTLAVSVVAFPVLCYSQSQCDSAVTGPLSLPIQNISLTDPVVRRGVALAVGTPPQNLAFQIRPYVFHTLGVKTAANTDKKGTQQHLRL
jgi:hypothetical protein